MSKFLIQCPNCGRYHEASSSLFASKKITCECGYEIDTKTDRYTSRTCPHCRNVVVYDQKKGSVCPVCHNSLIDSGNTSKLIDIHCPTCGCELHVDSNADTYTCPVCDTNINVQKEAKKEEILKQDRILTIKYEGANDVLVWKYPFEDFASGSQLIVHESQEAIFFRNGEALDSFGPGRYTLDTERLPLLGKTYKLPISQDNNIFHSEIYFVNLVTHTGLKWGTPSKIRLFDPVSGLNIDIGASGEFFLEIKEPRKLLIKLVGTTNGLKQNDISNTLTPESMNGMFRSIIITSVKSNLARIIREEGINILEIDEYLEDISNKLKDKINPVLGEYGLFMPQFTVMNIMTPDDDPNFRRMKEQYGERFIKVQQERILKAEAEARQERKLVEANTDVQMQLLKAQADAQAYRLKAQAEADEMRMKGYTYQQETQRQIGTAIASNPNGSSSGIANSLVDLGVGISLAKEVANNVTSAMNGNQKTQDSNTWECPQCHKTGLTSRFCPECGCPKPVLNTTWDCPKCGTKGITSKFCPNCGERKSGDAK